MNSPSGRLVDSGLEPTDLAARICPVGAILLKGQGADVAYATPRGARTYDGADIGQVGHYPSRVQSRP